MKKILSLYIFCIFLLLTACRSTPPASSDAKATADEPIVQEPTEPETDKLEEMVAKMTTEEKVGQLFFARCPDEKAVQTAVQYHLGGYILFGRDFENSTPDEVKSTIRNYQEASDIPMLIGVDEEGGTVVRVSCYYRDEPFPSPRDCYADGGWKEVESAESEKADLLLSLGINVNLSPVCDVTGDSAAFMYERSFSGNPDEVSQFADKTIHIYREKKLGSVLKHFPGYGDNGDTHTDMVTDERSYATFLDNDFKPFATGISAGADCVLVSHSIVKCMDTEFPASLSEKVHTILREDLRFIGVVMTDDLVMDAIQEYTGSDAAAVFAVKAGNDMICCSDLETQYPAVLQAVEQQKIPMEQIDQSVIRILKWKQRLGLL